MVLLSLFDGIYICFDTYVYFRRRFFIGKSLVFVSIVVWIDIDMI